ncbi:helix-turn-helix domain-containing protein, partial [Facklamia languida]
MTQTHSTTSGRKSKHLSFKERSQIELLKEQGHSNRAIARILKRAPQTIHNEIKRGTIKQIRQQ